MKYSSLPDDLLREDAFCLIPAAPVANYLDVDAASSPAVTVDRMGRWRLIVEGANTYSAEPARRAARARMERTVYRERGVLIVSLDSLLRMSSNPFFPYLLERIEEGIPSGAPGPALSG